MCILDFTNPSRPAGGVPLIPLPQALLNPGATDTRRSNKMSSIQSVLYNAASLLASIATGFDVRKATTKTQAQSMWVCFIKSIEWNLICGNLLHWFRVVKDASASFGGVHNTGFGDSEAELPNGIGITSAPGSLRSKYPHHTYHGQTVHYRPALSVNPAFQISNAQTESSVDHFEHAIHVHPPNTFPGSEGYATNITGHHPSSTPASVPTRGSVGTSSQGPQVGFLQCNASCILQYTRSSSMSPPLGVLGFVLVVFMLTVRLNLVVKVPSVMV